ncbi:hypothetical protein [Parapedobacter sp. 2B3]|uniref:hypothetical protein n=1 Tax=Parapedobacter sp. 2B3 TaxID=3342381 RepID=UPI0035B5E1FD
MKTAKLLTFSLLALIMLGMAALISCGKDDDVQPEETLDIRNPEGYFLYVRQSNHDGSYRSTFLFEFAAGKMVEIHLPNGVDSSPYTVIDDQTIDIGGGIRFVFNNNLITSNREDFQEIVLIKAQEKDQLAGKTFSGTYYHADMSVLHDNFFYSFAAGGNTVDVGLNVGTTLRTESYTSIGNFAARAELDNGDIEFLVLVNGKLEVNYKAQGVAGNHYGTFTRQ